jgi:hypothetical protein
MKVLMKITNTTTFSGLFVSVLSKSGMPYTYIRVAPDYWIYQSGGNGLDPWFAQDDLELAYLSSLVKVTA